MPPESDADPDAVLMARLQNGDVEAFERLVDRHKRSVVNVAARITRDPDEAEDLAQCVFLQVHKSAPRYRATAKFTTWLFTITRNVCLNELRRRQRHPADSLDEMETPREPGGFGRQFEDLGAIGPDDLALRSELVDKVALAVDHLPETQRVAITLYQREGLSYEEISKVLGCSLSATKSILFRARETLKLRLKPYLGAGRWEEPVSK